MKLRLTLAVLLAASLACAGGSSEPEGIGDEDAEKIADELIKAAEEAEEAEAEEAEEEEEEKVQRDKVTTTISVPADQKSTIKPKARAAIVDYAKSKGYKRVDDIDTSERCNANTCTVTVTGMATK